MKRIYVTLIFIESWVHSSSSLSDQLLNCNGQCHFQPYVSVTVNVCPHFFFYLELFIFWSQKNKCCRSITFLSTEFKHKLQASSYLPPLLKNKKQSHRNLHRTCNVSSGNCIGSNRYCNGCCGSRLVIYCLACSVYWIPFKDQ